MLSTTQSDKYRPPTKAKTQTCLSGCQTVKCDLSPLFWTPVAVCFTPLDLMLYIEVGDVRLGCSCLATETYSMKLPTHCSRANLKAHYTPQRPLTPFFSFSWPTTLRIGTPEFSFEYFLAIKCIFVGGNICGLHLKPSELCE